MLVGWILRMGSLSGVTETLWGACGDFVLVRTPTHSPPDVIIGMKKTRALSTQPLLSVPLSRLLRVRVFFMGRLDTLLECGWFSLRGAPPQGGCVQSAAQP
jgi:hypothetical protein